MKSEELLKTGLNEIGFSYSREQINTFMTFLSELKKWNRVYNLTALKTDEDIIIKHFLDSILYLKVIPVKPSGKHGQSFFSNGVKIADAGTGAGFPGIPIKIIDPGIDITFIESSRKKTVFLRHIIRLLKLNKVNVLNKRLETLGKNYEKTYDVIVSRATFKIKDFLKKACPYVKESGWLVLSKGPGVAKEIGELKNQRIINKIIRLQLPSGKNTSFAGAERNLLIIKCN